MARILGIGVATLDVIHRVDGYPEEDAKVRALARRIARGGNAANTLVVLSQLGHDCALAATLADDPDSRYLHADLAVHAIDAAPCHVVAGGGTPASYILHNVRNGSRTIVHYRDLPEYPYAAFERIDLAPFDWCHFEGRNVEETAAMLGRARRERGAPCSLEVEKSRPGIEALFGDADLILFGRDYVRLHADNPQAFLEAMRRRLPQARLVCTWGEAGAYGLDLDGPVRHSPAYPPPRLIDTLGAGDTFNAGVIDALIGGAALEEALAQACRLAGRKCGHDGLDFLRRS